MAVENGEVGGGVGGLKREDYLMRKAIDLHLGRYGKALEHLVMAGEGCFEEALEVARKQRLMKELLGLVKGDKGKETKVKGLVGVVRVQFMYTTVCRRKILKVVAIQL